MILGVKHAQQIEYHTAIQHFYGALEIANQYKTPDWKKRSAQAMINISGVLWSSKDVALAQKYHRASMAILQELDEPIVLADNYLGGAFFYIELQQYDSAELYLTQSLQIYRHKNDERKMATAYSKLGDVKFLQHKLDEALKYAQLGLQIRTTVSDSINLSWSHLQAGKLYLAKNQYPKAIYHYRQAVSLFERSGEKEGLVEIYPQMAAYFEKINQPDSALFYLKAYQQYLGEIYDEAKNKQVEQLKFQYETKEKEQENLLLRQQNAAARFRNLIFGIAAASFLAVILLLFRLFMRLRQKKELLQTANKNLQQLHTEKKFFTSLLTHDLRHPLAVIQLNLYELRHKNPTPELLSEMEHAADRIDEMSRRIMDVENMEEGITLSLQLTQVDATAVLDIAKSEYDKYAAHKNIDIKIQATPTPLRVMADPYFLQRIIGNLVSNAIKYSPDGSHILLSLEDAGAQARFLVTDKGPGLDVEDQAKAFQRFQRLKPQAQHSESSMGYGLFIARRYAEAMGGTLDLRSKKGKGSTFVLALPKGSSQQSAVSS
jgi:signal transduction histidine kinase